MSQSVGVAPLRQGGQLFSDSVSKARLPSNFAQHLPWACFQWPVRDYMVQVILQYRTWLLTRKVSGHCSTISAHPKLLDLMRSYQVPEESEELTSAGTTLFCQLVQLDVLPDATCSWRGTQVSTLCRP